MEKLKYQILETLNFINFYQRKKIKAIRVKRWYQIAFGIILTLIGVASYSKTIILVYRKPFFFDEMIIFMGLSLIGASIWILTRKPHDFPAKNLNSLSISELNNYLKEITKIENTMIDRGARQIASAFAILILTIMAILLPPAINYFKTGKLDLLNGKIAQDGLIITTAICIHFLGFVIANILGAPMSPKKYTKEKFKLSNKVIFCFLTNIDNSLLNPSKTK